MSLSIPPGRSEGLDGLSVERRTHVDAILKRIASSLPAPTPADKVSLSTAPDRRAQDAHEAARMDASTVETKAFLTTEVIRQKPDRSDVHRADVLQSFLKSV